MIWPFVTREKYEKALELIAIKEQRIVLLEKQLAAEPKASKTKPNNSIGKFRWGARRAVFEKQTFAESTAPRDTNQEIAKEQADVHH